MNISRIFILRPIATTLCMLGLLFSGLLVWRLLPVSALPQVDYPIIQVFTFQSGSNPDTVQRTITAPLEKEMGKIAGLKQMSSTSSLGASVITLQFELSSDLGVVEQEVQSAMNTASSYLPNDLPTPPIYRKVNPADVPVMTLAVSSPTLPLPQVYDMVDTRVAQKLSQLSGVGMVSLAGGQRPAIRVQVNPKALTALNLSHEEVRQAITAANVNQPKGSFDGQFRTTMLDANDQMRSVQDYQQLIIAWRNGTPIRLQDVAKIIESSEDRYMAAWADSQGAILINIQRQPNANVIQVAEQVQAILPELVKTLPDNIEVRVLTDRTESIRSSIRGVQKELVFAVCLVMMVTFLFLRNIPATLIPSIAVPLSIIGTFVLMYFLGFSVNNLTLMALTIATGFVVDDAIVMLENIARHYEAGKSRLQAALIGAKEIGFTLISLTISLIAVLIPLLFMGDVIGRLFHEFAITLAAAIALSLVVSLTLTPMMCAYMLKKHDRGNSETPKKAQFLDKTIEHYGMGLRWVLQHQTFTLLVMLGTVILAGLLYWSIPKGFFPVQDSGVIQVVTDAPDSISFQAMSERQQALASEILKDPDVASLSSFIGVDANNPKLSNGRILINLKPHGQRDSATVIMSRLRENLAQVQGIQAWLQPVQELSIEDKISRTQYQVSLSAPNLKQLTEWQEKYVEALRQRNEFIDVTSDTAGEGLQAYIEVNRDAAARLGVNLRDISDALQSAYAQRQIATLYTQSNQYRIVLEIDPQYAVGLDNLAQTYVRNAQGQPILLSSFASIVQKTAPTIIQQQSQFPATTLSFNVRDGVALGAAIKAIDEVKQQLNVPPEVALNLQGAAAAFENSLQHTFWLVIAAIVIMYIVLGMLYESFIHPVTILSTLPSAAIGALLALFMVGQALDMIALIGIILLIGLVKKNGIMMVDFALVAQREQGLSPEQAIYQAALLRFRPILMTTLAALVGAIPLMLATGSGAELRSPLGLVMVGGLIVSQFLTLFTTPVVYLFFDRLAQRKPQDNAVMDSGGSILNFSHLFIQRPVASFLLAIAIVLLGVLSYLKMPVSALPQIDIPMIVVRANLSGASPESMAATVATPLERAMTGVSGVKAIESSSNQGSTQVTLHFALDTDINEAAREVQAAINAAIPQLPSGMANPPQYFKVNPSQSPIFYLALSSPHLAAGDLYQIASTQLLPHLAQIQGVGEVEINGASMPAVRVVLNPKALMSQGVSLEQVRQAIANNNAVQAVGLVEQEHLRWQLQLSATLLKAEQFAEIVVHQTANGVVRLKDVAEVSESVENRYVSGFHNGKPVVIMMINRQPNANTIATIEQIKQKLPFLQALIPADSELKVVMDSSDVIRSGLNEARDTLLFSVFLVIVVTCLLLGRLRSAIMPTVAMTVTLVGVCSAIYLAGFSLNNLSIMALIVAIGLVIDDAIVVLENIERHIEAGLSPIQAALQGTKEVGMTLIAMNLALIVIFVAILFMGGVVERLFREFSLTLVFTIILSVFIALTLIPSLSTRIFKPIQEQQQSRLFKFSQSLLQHLGDMYKQSLTWLLRHGYLVIVLWLGAIAASVYFYQALPKQVIPEQDTGRIGAFIRGDDGFSYQVMQPKIQAIAEHILQDKAVQDVIGTAGGNGITNSFLTINLKPKDEREGESSKAIVERLKREAPLQAGAVFMARVEQDLDLGDQLASGSGQDYHLLMQSDDVSKLRKWTPILANEMEQRPEFAEVEKIGDEGAQHVTLQIDREAAKRLGVAMQDVASVLNNSFSQRQVSTIYDQRNQLHVVMEVNKQFTEQPESLAQVQVLNNQGQYVPLTNFATWSYGLANDRVHRRNQYAAMGIGYVLQEGYTPEQADAAIRELTAKIMLPQDVFIMLDRDVEAENLQSGLSAPYLILVVILLIYIVLGVTYENLAHPITILSTIPAVAVGALLTLWLIKMPFSLIALLGLFLLIGIVVKNAILLIDFALVEQRQGKSPQQAITQAAMLRFRPILMTNLAALIGAIPLAMGLGEGSEIRQPLGIAIVGGLALGQFLTLYTTPVIYLYVERLAQWLKNKDVKNEYHSSI